MSLSACLRYGRHVLSGSLLPYLATLGKTVLQACVSLPLDLLWVTT